MLWEVVWTGLYTFCPPSTSEFRITVVVEGFICDDFYRILYFLNHVFKMWWC